MIALVITIIVLLILAGVAVQTLAGNNGILNRTQEVTMQSQIAEAKEKITLAATDAFTEFYKKKYVENDSSYDDKDINQEVIDKIGSAEIQNQMPSQITISTDSTAIPPTITIYFGKPEGAGSVAQESVTGTVVSGKVTWGELINGSQLIAEQRNYGKTVSWANMPEGEVAKWRLFYTEGDTAYLLRDSIGSYALNNLSSWKEPSDITDADLTLAKQLNPEYQGWDKKTNNVLNYNIVGVASLCNENADEWKNYKTMIPGAKMVIGAPPIEMFVKSYNITHSALNYESLGVENITMAVKVLNKTTDKGYTPGINIEGGAVEDNAYSIWCGRFGNATVDKVIYFPQSGLFWIASPSASNYRDLMFGNNESGGCLYSYSCISFNMGIRPLVSVPKSSIGTTITLGTL